MSVPVSTSISGLDRTLSCTPSPDLAAAAVQAEITPIDDIRSTAGYRRAVTGRVLRRILLDA